MGRCWKTYDGSDMIVDDFSDVSSWAFVWSCCLSLCLPQVEIASLVWFAEDQEDCPRCQWALLSSSDNWGKLDQGWNHWQPKTWTAAAWSLVRTWNVDRDDDETLPAHTCHVFVSTIHYFHIPAISSNVFLILDTSDYFYHFLHCFCFFY